MKTKSLFYAFIFFLITHAFTCSASITETANGRISATVVEPVKLTEVTPLNFGTITSDGGIIEIKPSGERTGNNVIGNTYSAGKMMVSGPANQLITINQIADSVVTSGSNSMAVTGFNTNATAITLTGSGDSVLVGAKLNVSAGQPAGEYNGTYSISVTY